MFIMLVTPAWEKRFHPGQVFSCEFCEISKNTFFYRTPPVAASAGNSFHCWVLFLKKDAVILKLSLKMIAPYQGHKKNLIY